MLIPSDPRPRPYFPETAIIAVMIVFVTVLITKGMKPADAVLVVGCTGLLGAVVARVCTTTLLTARWRTAWAELQAAPV